MAVMHLLFLRDSERIDLWPPVACGNQGAMANLDSALVVVQFRGNFIESIFHQGSVMITPEDVNLDLKLRGVVKVCRDGRRRHSLRPLTDEERLIRFFSKVDKTATGGCWKWIGAVGGSSKYGHLNVNGKFIKAHRYSYEVHSGKKIPTGLIARHKCDNKLCVNPDHIEIGTQLDNIRDCIDRGRKRYGILRGNENARAIISEDQVREVVKLSSLKIPQREIAAKTGVSKTNVGAIVQGRTWRHVSGLGKTP